MSAAREQGAAQCGVDSDAIGPRCWHAWQVRLLTGSSPANGLPPKEFSSQQDRDSDPGLVWSIDNGRFKILLSK